MDTIFNNKIDKEIKLIGTPAKIISIEGIDGAGKTTIVDNCVEKLRSLGYKAEHFYTSSDMNVFWSVVNNALKENYISSDMNQVLHNIYFLTYLKSIFVEKLNNNDFLLTEWYIYGKLVLSELYTDNKNCNSKLLLENEIKNNNILLPDFSYFIDTDPKEAKKRIISRNGLYESKESYDMLVKAYAIWKRYIKKYNIELLNGMDSIDDNTDKVMKKILFKKGE